MDEVKNVRIGVPTIKDVLTKKEVWEREWDKFNSDEPETRQKKRRKEREWEKYESSNV